MSAGNGSFRARFQAMLDEVAQLEGVEIAVAEIADPADEAALAVARDLVGGVLPAGVEELYRELNGFSLEWSTADDAGAVGLLPVERVFADWEDQIWFDSDERFRSVKPVDLFVPEACVAFRQEPGRRPGDELWFHYLGEDMSPTGRTFPEYVELLLAARGYWYWSTALCADGDTPEGARFLERIGELFAGTPTDRFGPGPAA